MNIGSLWKIVRAASGGVLLLAITGYLASAAKPGDAKSQSPVPGSSPGGAPAAEFRGPAALPPSAPLPKLTADPAAPIAPPAKGEGQPPVGRPNVAKNRGIPFDPIAENGPIFKDWPKPKLAMVITGVEEGYIEPCGCAGLDFMKGGMGRRHTLFKELRQNGPEPTWIENKGDKPAPPRQGAWPVVGLDVGGLVHGFGRQAELKFQTLVESKLKMGYDAIGFGPDDLRMPLGDLISVAYGSGDRPSPFVSANVCLSAGDPRIPNAVRVIEAGGLKIGVTAVLGKEYRKEIHSDEIEITEPEAALQKILPELKKARPNYLVLLAHATTEESEELAKRFPDFNVVVTAGGFPVPPKEAQTIAGGKTLLITVGQKGMYAIVLGFMNDAAKTIRYQRVPLDSRFAASPDMKMLMTAYQDELKAIGFAGLGLRPVPHPLRDTNGRFVGSEKCMSCHEKSYDIWKKSLHGHAYDTLAKLDPPRNFDPECVSCHVTGWHPTKFFPYESGFESKEKTPLLVNTGCENCHGPGEKHCDVELAGSEALKQKYRKAVVITKAESEKQQCLSCHDLDNSPDFDFKAYWPFVEHYEKE